MKRIDFRLAILTLVYLDYLTKKSYLQLHDYARDKYNFSTYEIEKYFLVDFIYKYQTWKNNCKFS